jgi:hypothetical protein
MVPSRSPSIPNGGSSQETEARSQKDAGWNDTGYPIGEGFKRAIEKALGSHETAAYDPNRTS